jgi:hypothetical protein
MQPRPSRRLADPEHVRELRVAQAGVELERDQLTVTRSQVVERRADGGAAERHVGDVVGRLLGRSRLRDQRCQPTAAAELVERGVPGDSEHPGSLLAPSPVERAPAPVGTLERLGGDVLRGGRVFQQRGHVRVHVVATRAIKQLESLPRAEPHLRFVHPPDHIDTTTLGTIRHGLVIFCVVRLRHAIPVALGTLGLAVPTATASGPTPKQVQKAVRAAERSPELWATINVCNTRRHPRELGLRAEMPALGFSSSLYMTFAVYYRSDGRFKLDPGTTQRVSLGSRSGATVHQAGVTFKFTQAAVFKGKVMFTWRRAGKLLGRVFRTTTGHHKHVDFADPSGHSAARCTIP